MNRIKGFAFTLLILLNTHCFSQSNQELLKLRTLDSLAFEALEKGFSDVSEKSYALIEESAKYPPSLFHINGYTILGIINKHKGYYTTSLRHYIKALNISENIDDKARVSACLNNIGTVYHLQENHSMALDYFSKSLKIEDQLDNPLQKSIRFYNIGDVYKDMDSLDLALSFFTNSLLIEKKQGNQEGINYANLGIADIYLKSDRISDAEIVINKLSSSLKSYQTEEKILWNLLKSGLETKQGHAQEGISYLRRAEIDAKKDSMTSLLPDIFLEQVSIHKELKEWEKASNKYDEYVELTKKLNGTFVKNQLADLTLQNEINKKELEIQLIAEERDLAKSNAQSEKNISSFEKKIVWLLVCSIVLIIALVTISIRSNATPE